MLIFWIIPCVLCTQSVTNAELETVTDEWTDPFDMGRYSHGEKMPKTSTSGDQQTQGWVDPFDMTCYNHGQKRMMNECFLKNEAVKPNSEMSIKSVNENCQCKESRMEKNFLQRLINLLIDHCENNKKDNIQETSIIVQVTPEQLQELYRLRDTMESEAVIRLLNKIFSYMTTYGSPNIVVDFFTSEEVWSNVGVTSLALLPICVLIFGGTVRNIMSIFSLTVFAVGYCKTHKLLVKKLELENEHILSKHGQCSPHDWSWYHWIFGSNTEVECLKQLKALKIDPSLEVTPIKVISHMLAVGCFEPLEQFGIMFSRFSNEIFGAHSFLYGMFVFLIAIFVMIYIITVCYMGIFGKNLTIGSKHISLGITNTAHSGTGSRRVLTEPTDEREIVETPQREACSVRYEHSHQPVIQIIHNYSGSTADKSVVQNDCSIKHLVCKEGVSSETVSVNSQEESHKIEEITADNSGTEMDTKTACVGTDGKESGETETKKEKKL